MPQELPDSGGPDVLVPSPDAPHPEARGRGKIVMLDVAGGLTEPSVEKWLPFTFQVPPLESFPINRSYPHTDYETLSEGQRSRQGSVQLQTITFRTFFTEDIPRFTLLHGADFTPDPLFMLEKLNFIGEAETPIRMTARNTWRGSRYDYAGLVTLRDMNSEEVAGEPDTQYVTITFVQWKSTSITTRRIGGAGSGWRPSDNPRGSAGAPVSVVTNNLPEQLSTLYGLARQFYGDPTEWRRIARANGLAVAPSYDLNLLQTRKLVIPRR